MAKNWTLSQSFERLGTVPKNKRWSWSGRSADGKKVSVTLWQDLFQNGTMIYQSTATGTEEGWVGSNGHLELIENLVWARDHLDGEVSVIIAVAKDKTASPRSIAECFPQPNLIMRVIELDENSGDFTLERIG
ncbi:hypothetical protein HPDFL43_05505 [Hoeflea phototrophica DFL-43]|uniref:Uncharacterized protein n=1 Tax=Hoeflea phototrophica (strain DSM 17068 / NCIMB 14078 / DFL-43) TaxID=411684 RepID=A9D4I0_HOEPD|nr:hypothetical protein [Hoeflea phototrophica]EDQ33884.2 hypothetical protein HPDFL43_05505 [Hoeflea phototrophica DFL-43]